VGQALFLKALRVTLSGLGAGGKSANSSVDRLMEMRKSIQKRVVLKGETPVSWNAFIRNYQELKEGKRL
jgi:hypothetical protein